MQRRKLSQRPPEAWQFGLPDLMGHLLGHSTQYHACDLARATLPIVQQEHSTSYQRRAQCRRQEIAQVP